MATRQSLARPRMGALAATVSAILARCVQRGRAGAELEEIVVTGSQNRAAGLLGRQPDRHGRRASPSKTSAPSASRRALNMLPQFQPAGTQFVDTDVQASAFNTPGISSVNLRGLGTNRNLVLVNGRRPQPANATLVVDVNSIPAAAIANVEVITRRRVSRVRRGCHRRRREFHLEGRLRGPEPRPADELDRSEGDGEETRFSVLMGAQLRRRSRERHGRPRDGRTANRSSDQDRDFYRRRLGRSAHDVRGVRRPDGLRPARQRDRPPARCQTRVCPDAPGEPARRRQFFVNPDGTVFKQTAARRLHGATSGPGTPCQNQRVPAGGT